MNAPVSLVAINSDGTPRGYGGALPELAGEVLRATVDLYEIVGFEEPWIGYLASANGVRLAPAGSNRRHTMVGSEDGSVWE